MKDEATRELLNWRRANSDNWLEDHLGVAPQPIFREVVAVSGYDEPDNPQPPIDEQLADRTEAIVVKIGTIDSDIYEALVGYWPFGRSKERIAQDMGKSVLYVKACLVAGERMYQKMRKR